MRGRAHARRMLKGLVADLDLLHLNITMIRRINTAIPSSLWIILEEGIVVFIVR